MGPGPAYNFTLRTYGDYGSVTTVGYFEAPVVMQPPRGEIDITTGTREFSQSPGLMHGPETASENLSSKLAFNGPHLYTAREFSVHGNTLFFHPVG
jgi:hypothetical protein